MLSYGSSNKLNKRKCQTNKCGLKKYGKHVKNVVLPTVAAIKTFTLIQQSSKQLMKANFKRLYNYK